MNSETKCYFKVIEYSLQGLSSVTWISRPSIKCMSVIYFGY